MSYILYSKIIGWPKIDVLCLIVESVSPLSDKASALWLMDLSDGPPKPFNGDPNADDSFIRKAALVMGSDGFPTNKVVEVAWNPKTNTVLPNDGEAIGAYFRSRKAKPCTCGGTKARTTHSSWCDSQ